jgi:hypothetical protein
MPVNVINVPTGTQDHYPPASAALRLLSFGREYRIELRVDPTCWSAASLSLYRQTAPAWHHQLGGLKRNQRQAAYRIVSN